MGKVNVNQGDFEWPADESAFVEGLADWKEECVSVGGLFFGATDVGSPEFRARFVQAFDDQLEENMPLFEFLAEN